MNIKNTDIYLKRNTPSFIYYSTELKENALFGKFLITNNKTDSNVTLNSECEYENSFKTISNSSDNQLVEKIKKYKIPIM